MVAMEDVAESRVESKDPGCCSHSKATSEDAREDGCCLQPARAATESTESAEKHSHVERCCSHGNHWDRVKRRYHLCDFGSLPDYLRDNEYIHGYYRANWPLKHTLWSIFHIHNETGNIWTHLIGFILFLNLTIYTARQFPKVVEIPLSHLPHLHFPESWVNATDSLHTHLKDFPDLQSLSRMVHHMELPDLRPIRDAITSMEFPNLNTMYNSLPHVELSGISDISTSIYESMPHVPNVQEMQGMLSAALKSRFSDLDTAKIQAMFQAMLHQLELPELPHLELPKLQLQQVQAALLWYYSCLYSYANSALPESSPASPASPLWDRHGIFGNCSLSESPSFLLGPGKAQSSSSSPSIAMWPFYVFLTGAMVCLLSSSTCHLLGCHSKKVSQIIWRFDYAGIAVLICASFFPPVYYGFQCHPWAQIIYLGFVTAAGIGTVAVSLLPAFQKPKYRAMRAGIFFGLGVSGIFPVIHGLILYWHEPFLVTTIMYELLMGAIYGIGALFYATRIPERWLPGRFDIAGHSHQIFHVLVIAGAYTHYQAGLRYLQWVDGRTC